MRIPKSVEQRATSTQFDLTENEGKKYIEGYAIVFNELSVDLGGFVETILPEAVNLDTIYRSDIFMLINHDRNYGLLARSKFEKGTLKIKILEKGVFFSFEVPDTQAGNDIYESIKRGDVSECSFAFTVTQPDGDIIQTLDDKTFKRTVKNIHRIYDFSIVDNAAYETTEVEAALRSVDKYKEEIKKNKLEEEQRELNIQALKNKLKKRYKL
jgi:HK97 family phage prohead protease